MLNRSVVSLQPPHPINQICRFATISLKDFFLADSKINIDWFKLIWVFVAVTAETHHSHLQCPSCYDQFVSACQYVYRNVRYPCCWPLQWGQWEALWQFSTLLFHHVPGLSFPKYFRQHIDWNSQSFSCCLYLLLRSETWFNTNWGIVFLHHTISLRSNSTNGFTT